MSQGQGDPAGPWLPDLDLWALMHGGCWVSESQGQVDLLGSESPGLFLGPPAW